MLPKIRKTSKNHNTKFTLNRYKSQIIKQPNKQFHIQRSLSRPRFEKNKSGFLKQKMENNSLQLEKEDGDPPTKSSKRKKLGVLKFNDEKDIAPVNFDRKKMKIRTPKLIKLDENEKINILKKLNKKILTKKQDLEDNDFLELLDKERKVAEKVNKIRMVRKSLDESPNNSIYLKNNFQRKRNSRTFQSLDISNTKINLISESEELAVTENSRDSRKFKKRVIKKDKSFFKKSRYKKLEMFDELTPKKKKLLPQLELRTDLKIDMIKEVSSRRKVFTNIGHRLMAGFKQGMIKTNQDNIFIDTNVLRDGETSLLAVFDGHGIHGHYVSKFLVDNIKGYSTYNYSS